MFDRAIELNPTNLKSYFNKGSENNSKNNSKEYFIET